MWRTSIQYFSCISFQKKKVQPPKKSSKVPSQKTDFHPKIEGYLFYYSENWISSFSQLCFCSPPQQILAENPNDNPQHLVMCLASVGIGPLPDVALGRLHGLRWLYRVGKRGKGKRLGNEKTGEVGGVFSWRFLEVQRVGFETWL